jgi:uncharacterized SAM-binding protein YcdF (DUF218 family)
VQSILIVTDWWHSRRSLAVLEHHLVNSGIAVYCAPLTDRGHDPEDWWRRGDSRRLVVRELAKIAFYGVRYGVLPFYSAA